MQQNVFLLNYGTNFLLADATAPLFTLVTSTSCWFLASKDSWNTNADSKLLLVRFYVDKNVSFLSLQQAIAYIGGTLFLVFAAVTLVEIVS